MTKFLHSSGGANDVSVTKFLNEAVAHYLDSSVTKFLQTVSDDLSTAKFLAQRNGDPQVAKYLQQALDDIAVTKYMENVMTKFMETQEDGFVADHGLTHGLEHHGVDYPHHGHNLASSNDITVTKFLNNPANDTSVTKFMDTANDTSVTKFLN